MYGSWTYESLGLGAYVLRNWFMGWRAGGVLDDFGNLVNVDTQQMRVSSQD